MARRVLVTRPQPGAAQTARRLQALGFEPVLLPLSETQPLAVGPESLPEAVAAVAATSASALRHASPALLAPLVALPCHVVGGATAQAAREAGFADIRQGPGDAEGLARELVAAPPAGPLVYLCGRVRRPVFEARLADAGVSLHPVETYATLRPQGAPVTPAAFGGSIDAVLLHSVFAAEELAVLAGRPGIAALIGSASFLCLSQRIAAALPAQVADRTVVAPEPGDDALLTLLAALDWPSP